MGLVHGVVGHSFFAPPPPTGTVSSRIGSIISIGLSVAAARSLAEDAASLVLAGHNAVGDHRLVSINRYMLHDDLLLPSVSC